MKTKRGWNNTWLLFFFPTFQVNIRVQPVQTVKMFSLLVFLLSFSTSCNSLETQSQTYKPPRWHLAVWRCSHTQHGNVVAAEMLPLTPPAGSEHYGLTRFKKLVFSSHMLVFFYGVSQLTPLAPADSTTVSHYCVETQLSLLYPRQTKV